MKNRIIALLCVGVLWLSGCASKNDTVESPPIDNSQKAEEPAADIYTEDAVSSDIEVEPQDTSPSMDLLYVELGFSVEDFKYAGYSVMDGDHVDEVFQIVSEAFPAPDNYIFDEKWVHNPKINWPKEVWTYFSRKVNHTLNTSAGIRYKVDDHLSGEGMPVEISLQIEYDPDHVGEKIVSEYPLLESPILPEMSYDEVLEILGLADVVNTAEQNNIDGDYVFESQYGETHCRFDYFKYPAHPDAENFAICYGNEAVSFSFLNGYLFCINCSTRIYS